MKPVPVGMADTREREASPAARARRYRIAYFGKSVGTRRERKGKTEDPMKKKMSENKGIYASRIFCTQNIPATGALFQP